MKPTILYSTPILKYPSTGGPFIRIENSIKALAQISHLHIYCRSSFLSIGGNQCLAYYKSISESFQLCPYNKLNYIKASINVISESLIQNSIYPISLENNIIYKDFLDIANEIHPDIIWLGYGNLSYPLLRYIKIHSKYKVIIDTDSVMSWVLKRGKEFFNDTHSKIIREKIDRKEKEEIWGTKLADSTTAVSEIDAQYYKNISNNPKKIYRFSNVIDINSYLPIKNKSWNLAFPYLLLPGSFGKQSPMEDAARWFISDIFPLVQKQIPDIHLYLIGSGAVKTLSDIKNNYIHIIGETPSLVPYFQNASVIIVPIRFESGTRYKILEAGACEKPVVSTKLGAEGLELIDNFNILIADTPKLFSNKIIQLVKNLKFAQNIANNLKKTVINKYSIPSAIEEATKILDYIK